MNPRDVITKDVTVNELKKGSMYSQLISIAAKNFDYPTQSRKTKNAMAEAIKIKESGGMDKKTASSSVKEDVISLYEKSIPKQS